MKKVMKFVNNQIIINNVNFDNNLELRALSAWLFGICRSFVNIQKSKNSLLVLWVKILSNSILLQNLNEIEKLNFILNELYDFQNIGKYGDLILLGSINIEEEFLIFDEDFIYIERNLSKLIK